MFQINETAEQSVMMSSHKHLHWLDYVIFSLMILISCGMGIYHAVKAKKGHKEEYLMGSRKMTWFPVAVSLVVTYTSGISQLGKPAEVYQYGIQYVLGIIGIGVGLFVPMVTFIPLLFRLKVTSAYEVRYFTTFYHNTYHYANCIVPKQCLQLSLPVCQRHRYNSLLTNLPTNIPNAWPCDNNYDTTLPTARL